MHTTFPKTERNARILAAWESGKYRNKNRLANVFRVTPKIVYRIIERAGKKE